MKKSLNTLIRMCEWDVDQKRRELGVKLKLLSITESKVKALNDELKVEQTYVEANPLEGGFNYGNYGDAVIKKQEVIRGRIDAIKSEIITLREELSLSYNKLKKFEVLTKNRLNLEKIELDRKSQETVDDLNITNFMRKKVGS